MGDRQATDRLAALSGSKHNGGVSHSLAGDAVSLFFFFFFLPLFLSLSAPQMAHPRRKELPEFDALRGNGWGRGLHSTKK